MATHSQSDLQFEIGHVLFIDIAGYSKLLINEQSELIRQLKEVVRGTEQFRLAEALLAPIVGFLRPCRQVKCAGERRTGKIVKQGRRFTCARQVSFPKKSRVCALSPSKLLSTAQLR